MKYRYLKITDRTEMVGTDSVSSKDLVDVRDGYHEMLVDLEDFKFYNPETNAWEPIKGTGSK